MYHVQCTVYSLLFTVDLRILVFEPQSSEHLGYQSAYWFDFMIKLVRFLLYDVAEVIGRPKLKLVLWHYLNPIQLYLHLVIRENA